jgi:hypothetical protein
LGTLILTVSEEDLISTINNNLSKAETTPCRSLRETGELDENSTSQDALYAEGQEIPENRP